MKPLVSKSSRGTWFKRTVRRRCMKAKLENMRKQANNHQTQLEELIQKLSEPEGLDSANIQEVANETEQKVSQIMKIYLGDQPDSSEAIEFLCLAEVGEVTHYEVLSDISAF